MSKKWKRAGAIVLSLVVIGLVGYFALSYFLPNDAQPQASDAQTQPRSQATHTPSPTPEPIPEVSFTVAATGDVLSHSPVVAHSREADGSYDFAKLMPDVKPYIENSDLSIFHCELPFVLDDARIHGYPVFGAPKTWTDSVKAMGYDGASLASNHTWDQGEEGIYNTIQLFSDRSLGTSGANNSQDQDPIQYYTLKRDGRTVKIAHLSMTYGTNFGEVPAFREKPWLIHQDNPEHMIELAKKARDEGEADVVIVSAHGGNEYQSQPNEQQLEWAKMFAESKVIDLYIGHHVHVPQPKQKFDGGVDGDGMYAFFGTGNLLSNMQMSQGIGTQTGYIARATITLPSEGPAHVDNVGYTGLLLDSATNQVFPAHDYQQSQHPGSRLTDSTAQSIYAHLKEVMGDTPELTDAPTKAGEAPKALPR